MPFRTTAVLLLLCAPTAALAHDGHVHAEATPEQTSTAAPPADAVTGAGEFRFRYNAELSELPAEVNEHLVKAHGGFAKAPNGEIYFGLKNCGPVRISADLKTKTVIPSSEAVRTGGLHNTAYLNRDGGVLVLPDNEHAEIHIISKEGQDIARMGRPAVNDYYRDEANPYRPTDVEFAAGGRMVVCDGYSPGKYVLTADVDKAEYEDFYFGGAVPGDGRTSGKFSTNHGVTLDPADNALVIADRERQWLQRFNQEGEFLGSIDLVDANPCDVDFVDWQGEQLAVVGCLQGKDGEPGVVKLVRGDKVIATLRPQEDLGIKEFDHIHNAAGVVVGGKLYVLCYGWNPGCYAVLEHVSE
ncbi:hypothetical protein Pla123a_38240 [Posidoniimonas polymericola]|uniref:NHL repeat protein n=1 Tax=Posidoniimonas polymericola TaxID=2528002 RepID=A0A5C5YES1_9BACT|nr:hypothetical protein [Posidoniimonas polymericola]TWT73488.1 hypothetical protein Pla123a_38240 [Posidoniimonas polymericola]